MPTIYAGNVSIPRATDAITLEGSPFTKTWYNFIWDIHRRTGGTINGVLSNNLLTETASEITLITGATFNFTDVGAIEIAGVSVTPTAAELNVLDGTVLSNGGIVWSSATNFQVLAGVASAGKMLQSGNLAAPTWSTPTWPSASGTAGKLIISDGTNNVYSTPTYPNTSGTSGQLLQSNGTNIVFSTATFPTSVGATGTILRSDGTNWVATTATYPATTTINQFLYSTSANVIGALAVTNSAVLTSKSDGVPEYKTLTANLVFTGTTLDTVQGIQTTSSPTFSKVTLSGDVLESLSVSGTTTTRSGTDMYAVRLNKIFAPDGNVGSLFNYRAVTNLVDVSSRTMTEVYGIQSQVALASTNTSAITDLWGVQSRITMQAATTGSVTRAYGFHYRTNATTDPGICTNAWSIHAAKPDFGTNKYCAYLEGPVGIGTTTPTETLHVSGSLALKRTATAVTMSVGSTDYLIAVTSTAAARTITLPAAASTTVGRTIVVKDESGACATNNITVDTAGGNIDGAANKVMNVNYSSYTFYNNGTNWFII